MTISVVELRFVSNFIDVFCQRKLLFLHSLHFVSYLEH